MENEYIERMSSKSNFDLNMIINKRQLYNKDAILAAITILERRNEADNNLLLIKNEVLNRRETENNLEIEKVEENRKSFNETIHAIIPDNNYYVTPIIVYINIAIYLIMFFQGFNPFEPSIEYLIKWGGNLRELTINGEEWRLITSMFIHKGFFHLVFNSYFFLFIGKELETFLGKKKFIFSYIMVGVFGSISSVLYNSNVVSIGSSGAVLGMYGLITILFFNKSFKLAKNRRKSYVNSIMYIIIYNMVNGLKVEGIDNAAHIGGYLFGIIIGLIFNISPESKRYEKLKYAIITIIVIFIIIKMPTFIIN